MQRVSDLGELIVLSKVNQTIFNILNDENLGRTRVVNKLRDDCNILISEKIVRNYRAKSNAPLDQEIIFHLSDWKTPTTVSTKEKIKPLFSDGSEMKITQGTARSTKTIVVMPDVQAPLHDKILVNKFVDFIQDFQPTEIAQVGDFTDSTEISRWVRGKKPEFAGDLRNGFIEAQYILEDIREVFDGRFRIVRSNHDDRLELYIKSCAPGLASFGDHELSFESLMHFDDYEVEFIRDGVVELVKDEWIMGHGDEGSLSPQAGKTAFGLAKNKFGVNVVCGHTHRAGQTTESYGYNGKIRRSLTGLEVGHFMDLRQAEYLDKSGRTANWQQAFGILETINGKTFPHLINVYDGEFSYQGVMY